MGEPRLPLRISTMCVRCGRITETTRLALEDGDAFCAVCVRLLEQHPRFVVRQQIRRAVERCAECGARSCYATRPDHEWRAREQFPPYLNWLRSNVHAAGTPCCWRHAPVAREGWL